MGYGMGDPRMAQHLNSPRDREADDTDPHAGDRVFLEGRLRRAFERDAFEVAYQPQAHLDHMTVTGMEALARMRDEDGTLIPPAAFIPVAEATGLIVPLGDLILRIACRQMAAWRQSGIDGLNMSVNLSGRRLDEPRLAATVTEVLDETGLPPRLLTLELTETALLHGTPQARQDMFDLHDMGVRFALDDFGTGYSSLSHLKRFPIDVIKVDKSFIQAMVDDSDTASIVNAIISMAHALKMTVVAEGVETREQLLYLRAYKCDRFQGYLLARPLAPEDLPEFLVDHR